MFIAVKLRKVELAMANDFLLAVDGRQIRRGTASSVLANDRKIKEAIEKLELGR